MATKATSLLVYAPPVSGSPYLSVITWPGQESSPLVTSFATELEAETFNREMSIELSSGRE